ncbi:MAG: CDP-diacylglycerol--glycerol-3-phosphate 3-phosphatidyltransferase [Rhizobacter sp.]
MWRNLPMLLTWARIAMIPVLVGIDFLPNAEMSPHDKNVWQGALFVIAAVTDYFDGFLARRYQLVTRLGAFLDPVADKLMVCAALILLVNQHRIGVLITLIIIGREIGITALREWMSQIGKRDAVSVHWLGKAKANAQMAAIALLLWHDPLFEVNVVLIGHMLAVTAAVLTVWSAGHYLWLAAPHLREK